MNRLLQRLGILIAVLACTSAMGYGQIYVDANASGANDGSTWENAYTDLQNALAAALEEDEIWVAAGTYSPGPDTLSYFELVEGVKLYGGFDGSETSVDDRDPEANPTVLSGDVAGDDVPGDFANNRTDNNFHVVYADSFITNATVLSGFTISGGNSSLESLPGELRDSGGGILTYGSPVISNCILTDNSARSGGALVPVGEHASSIKVLNCQIIRNNGVFGGAIQCISILGGLFMDCDISENTSASSGSAMYNFFSIDTFINCTVNENQAPNANSGGAFVNDGSFGTYINCEFTNNIAGGGGGGFTAFRGENPQVTLNDCSFSGNSGTFGGALSAQSGTNMLNNCTFENNEASFSGGAISIAFAPTLIINNSVIRENQAVQTSGGIYVQNDTTTLSATNTIWEENTISDDGFSGGIGVFFTGGCHGTFDSCQFVGNNHGFQDENGSGGAITYNGDSIGDATLDISKTTFIGNQAGQQGGALTLSNVTTNIVNSIFAFNMSNVGGAIINNATFASGSPMLLLNNTFYQNIGDFATDIAQWENPERPDALCSATLQNNIFVEGVGGPVYAIEDGTPDLTSNGGNLIRDMSLGAAAVPEDVENENDAGLVDPVNSLNFRVDSASNAQDIGVNTGAPTDDITDSVRLTADNTIVDAGAFERHPPLASQNYFADFNIDMNPTLTNDEVTINFDSEEMGEVQVLMFDYNGKIVYRSTEEKMAPTFKRTYSVSHLPAGSYMVRIMTGESIGGGKFVVAQ